MPQPSDSNYAAVSRHRRPFSTGGRPAVLLDENDGFFSFQVKDEPNEPNNNHNSSSNNNNNNGGSGSGSSWASECLPDDDIPVGRHEAVVAPLLEEGELDADAVVVSPTGNSSVAANHATERRRREEGWTDLGLDQFTASSGSMSGRLMMINNMRSGSSSRNPRTTTGGSG